MALRDQPYLPLYIQDIMTDEKLNECSASTHGIYIKGIMCLMHKSEHYGKILLKQKDKQTDKQSRNFAIKCDKHLPYTVEQIEQAIDELVSEGVLHIDGDALCQKRMIKDNQISELRAKAGAKGASKKAAFANPKESAKTLANSENENECEIESENGINPSSEFPQEPEILDEWLRWGKMIVDGNDHIWDQMRMRKVSEKEMDAFISVAIRNGWNDVNTQQKFRHSLKGFDFMKFSQNGNGKGPAPTPAVYQKGRGLGEGEE